MSENEQWHAVNEILSWHRAYSVGAFVISSLEKTKLTNFKIGVKNVLTTISYFIRKKIEINTEIRTPKKPNKLDISGANN